MSSVVQKATLVDGIGTTAYSYDEVGQLLSEGGLSPDPKASELPERYN